MAADRKQLDWEAIERDYRAGQMTVREIAAKHGCANPTIVIKAKRLGWARDLGPKIRAKAQADLASRAASEERSRRDEPAIIEAAASRAVRAVEGHLARSQRLAAIAERNMAALEAIQRGETPAFDPFPTKGDSLVQLIRATADLVGRSSDLERKALNLDSLPQEQQPMVEID